MQRGPQILAVDGALNSAAINDLVTNSKTVIPVDNLNLVNESKILPNNWFGKQAYSLTMLNNNEKIIMVPFAEASQTEGEMKVWLPLQIKN